MKNGDKVRVLNIPMENPFGQVSNEVMELVVICKVGDNGRYIARHPFDDDKQLIIKQDSFGLFQYTGKVFK